MSLRRNPSGGTFHSLRCPLMSVGVALKNLNLQCFIIVPSGVWPLASLWRGFLMNMPHTITHMPTWHLPNSVCSGGIVLLFTVSGRKVHLENVYFHHWKASSVLTNIPALWKLVRHGRSSFCLTRDLGGVVRVLLRLLDSFWCVCVCVCVPSLSGYLVAIFVDLASCCCHEPLGGGLWSDVSRPGKKTPAAKKLCMFDFVTLSEFLSKIYWSTDVLL